MPCLLTQTGRSRPVRDFNSSRLGLGLMVVFFSVSVSEVSVSRDRCLGVPWPNGPLTENYLSFPSTETKTHDKEMFINLNLTVLGLRLIQQKGGCQSPSRCIRLRSKTKINEFHESLSRRIRSVDWRPRQVLDPQEGWLRLRPKTFFVSTDPLPRQRQWYLWLGFPQPHFPNAGLRKPEDREICIFLLSLSRRWKAHKSLELRLNLNRSWHMATLVRTIPRSVLSHIQRICLFRYLKLLFSTTTSNFTPRPGCTIIWSWTRGPNVIHVTPGKASYRRFQLRFWLRGVQP